MRQYLDLLETILEEGTDKPDRTGTGTRSLFGYQMRFDLGKGFPAVTTKKLFMRSVVHELIWFLRADPHIDYLREHDVSIWDEWADASGDVGPVYGVQWRSWPAPDGQRIDQLRRAVERIEESPHSRRHVVSAWNPGQLDEMALPPCHVLFQFYVADGALSCQLYQRSGDVFLGVPFNIASYSLLTHLVARVTGLEVGTFVHTFGDVHLYRNHFDQARTQLEREPLERPRLKLADDIDDIDDLRADDVELVNYRHHEAIPAPISV